MLAVKSVLRTDFTASSQLCPIFSSKSDGSALALPFVNDPTEVKMFLAHPLEPADWLRPEQRAASHPGKSPNGLLMPEACNQVMRILLTIGM